MKFILPLTRFNPYFTFGSETDLHLVRLVFAVFNFESNQRDRVNLYAV